MDESKVALPSPCGETWESMTPQGCNRHCSACDKTIHDLSLLTITEAEDLLDTAEEVCVRARVGADGVVALAPSRDATKRRMIAAVGASITLATAACQTVPDPDRPNRFAISGSLPLAFGLTPPVVRSSDGRSWEVRMEYKSKAFLVPNLYPGTYTITYNDMCHQGLVVEDIVIEGASVGLGELPQHADECIIVGVMVPLERSARG